MSADVARRSNSYYSASEAGGTWNDWAQQQGHSSQMPQQYALPIHRPGVRRTNSEGSSRAGDETPRAEYTLRRKTPNGTLNAGYDGSINDLNPNKHQLLPLSEGNTPGYLPPPNVNGNAKRTFLQHQHMQGSGLATQWDGANGFPWQPPQSSIPVMDSMFQQMPIHQYQQQYYGSSVPSVVQPSFQYLVGPTASGIQGSGPYGPYWHDGTFVPYRPAAVRDPRFYHHPMTNWSAPLPNSYFAPQQPNAWQPNGFPQPSWPQNHGMNHFEVPPNAYPPQVASQAQPLGAYNDATPTGSRHHSLDLGQAQAPTAKQQTNHQYMSSHGHAHPAQVIEEEYGPSSPKGRQRDKTFAWALDQYRQLLGFIHQARRHQQQSRHAQGQPAVQQKPSFYPKPPNFSRSGSALKVQKRRNDTDLNRRLDDAVVLKAPSHTDNTPADDSSRSSDSELEAPRLRASSILTPSAIKFHDNEYNRRASHDQYQSAQQPWPHPPQQQSDRYRTIRRSHGSSVSSVLAPGQQDETPLVRAVAALTQLTEICKDTDWQWTDGMHLGGCLAYALGDYKKAKGWYQQVLEMDPKHLEATSNLAATLLALGDRREAEQCWMQVVKAAPNHFEAVEHLIGMLCNEQRSKDAIKIIEYVERSLRQLKTSDARKVSAGQSDRSVSMASCSPSISELSDKALYDFDADDEALGMDLRDMPGSQEPGFGSSGFAIPGSDNGRILALIHAKGNMLYGLGDNAGAARAFEDAVLIAAGRKFNGIQGLVRHIMNVVSVTLSQQRHSYQAAPSKNSSEPILLTPEQALATSKLCFPYFGELPGLQHVPGGPQSLARKAVISTTSNSLLSLAKIFQDGMSTSSRSAGITPLGSGVRDILSLYYLSLSLQPSPSTANNVGILLASVQQAAPVTQIPQKLDYLGVVPGSGTALAFQYYNYGLQLDRHHAHLYTNLGSLLKDIGHLDPAITMYERAVKCDGKFDIALANLANAVKDKGRINDAIGYYKRAVEVSPEFAEAVCGLANALNSVCSWHARGGIAENHGKRDRWHVDPSGMLLDARQPGASSSGWIKRVVDIVEKQLVDGENWGTGTITPTILDQMVPQLTILEGSVADVQAREANLRQTLSAWAGQKWEGARITRIIERMTRRIGWHWYQDLHVTGKPRIAASYDRPQLPASLTIPTAPTVLPFHTFTCPMSAKQIRLISQRNGLRISVSTLRAPWLPKQVYPPPAAPAPYLKVGYVSSDFNNHPLAHLMQSVFGLHDQRRAKAYCYATTQSDNSVHRQQIQSESPVFHDASGWSAERLTKQIVQDGIHILINLNGYTRGARNEVFAARPAPIQMSFMGFAGTLGAEWCDYLLADKMAVPPSTLRPWRRNIDVEDQLSDENSGGSNDDWVYGENIIYCRDTFFCCDHKQSAPDSKETRISWDEEQKRRWQMRKELFPQISDETVIFGNFNQLYKIEPTTFRTWLRILARVPNSILWLLRFPDLGESHLLATARQWAGADVASRVIFTDVAPKHLHISRARVCDLVLDTAECNAHTTAADVLWSGTPLLTLPRYSYKMCSRMAASILQGALPKTADGAQAGKELIASTEEDYEEKAVALGKAFSYPPQSQGKGEGRLMDLRQMLFEARWTSALFDTKRWVSDLEDAYDEAWKRWVDGIGGDIWLDDVPRGRRDA